MAKCKDVELRKTFDRYDTDHSGFIETKELRKAVKESLAGQNPTDDDVDVDAVTNSIMKKVDTSGDGKISFEEFKKGFA